MKKLILLTLTIFIGLSGKTQEVESKYDLRFGVGTSLLGTGDMRTLMLENEFNFKLNQYFTLGGGIGYAKSDYGVFEQASFVQMNSNVYISPLKNNRKNDFRLGTGLTWYAVSDVYRSSTTYQNGQVIDAEYKFDKRNSIGLNVVVENTYSITEKYMLGLKLFTQPYLNGDINSGILLRFGVKI